jgi:hypothetical protein
MSGTAIALFVSGALVELVGIVLLASPDLVPYAQRLSAWLAPRVHRVLRRLRLRSGRTVFAEAGVIGAGGISAQGIVGIRDDASHEEKVAYLLRRDEATQRLLNEHGERLSALEGGLPERLEELRGQMEAHVQTAIAETHRRYLEVRVVGAFLVAIGLSCATAANFA